MAALAAKLPTASRRSRGMLTTFAKRSEMRSSSTRLTPLLGPGKNINSSQTLTNLHRKRHRAATTHDPDLDLIFILQRLQQANRLRRIGERHAVDFRHRVVVLEAGLFI